MEQWYI